MKKLLFLPLSVGGGMVAGLVARKGFDALWSVLDAEEAPNPQHREIALMKLIPALLLEGAITRAVRGIVDHGARRAFWRATGSWPGEERPEPK